MTSSPSSGSPTARGSPLTRLVKRLSRKLSPANSHENLAVLAHLNNHHDEPAELIHCSSTTGSNITFDPHKYHSIKRLGKGNYGHVDLVESNGYKFALKEQKTKRSGFTGEVDLYVKVSKAGDHKNITKLYYASSSRHKMGIIAIEYCEGVCLDILHGSLNEMQIRHIVRETLSGIAFLHSLSIVHRDIKPDNIMITKTGEVKLIDLGMADDMSIHVVDDPCGSPLYMAPEHINCIDHPHPYDAKVDIWALGITCIELATGYIPHSEIKRTEKLVMAVTLGGPPTLSLMQREHKHPLFFDESFHDFITSCLTKSPQDRPSAQSLLEHQFLKPATDQRELNSLIDLVTRKMDEKR